MANVASSESPAQAPSAMGVHRSAEKLTPADTNGYSVKKVTQQPFTPKAEREEKFAFGALTTTDVCNLECVMCHFNGPSATKKNTQLSPELVRKSMDELPVGSDVFISSAGDLFMDPHAEEYIAYVLARGHRPMIQSHGQLYTPERLERLLAMGARIFFMSCDTIDPVQYAKIRRGGEFQKIIDAIDYLNSRRLTYSGIEIHIGVTMFRKTFDKQDEIVEFWRGKVDAVDFNAEYYDTWRFRNVFNAPTERRDCKIRTYIQPSGKITPCCAIGVHGHENDLDWLPSLQTHTLEEAYKYLCDLYDDPNSPLGKHCASCDWWIMWTPDAQGLTPYMRSVPLPTPGKIEEDEIVQPLVTEPATAPNFFAKLSRLWRGSSTTGRA